VTVREKDRERERKESDLGDGSRGGEL